ncbi:hypothetical protein [Parasphingorhabdus sp.]|uniref:hypothetical protein n=1 Tax=Parasphingorhabdus sp. TaxID=2709688 RepID=UPI003594936A
MIGPIFYIVLIFALVALPAIAGWKLSRKQGQFTRMAGTIAAGQMILTPGIIWIVYSTGSGPDQNPVRTIIIYAGMAIVISIMTFAVLEIKNTRRNR